MLCCFWPATPPLSQHHTPLIISSTNPSFRRLQCRANFFASQRIKPEDYTVWSQQVLTTARQFNSSSCQDHHKKLGVRMVSCCLMKFKTHIKRGILSLPSSSSNSWTGSLIAVWRHTFLIHFLTNWTVSNQRHYGQKSQELWQDQPCLQTRTTFKF